MGAAHTRSRPGAKTDGRVERGNATRRLVLARTMEIASVEGLEGLSLGRIAGELELSKSGVFALFGSKEELQLATVRAARAVFVREVVTPLQGHRPGLELVAQVCERWLVYSRDRTFPGGCFFFAVGAEFDARSGPVRDAVAANHREWARWVEQAVAEAAAAGELCAEAEPAQLAFEFIALLETANLHSLLHDDPTAYERAGKGILSRLRAVAVDPDALPAQLGG
ncbi:MAG: TetR/AcrR family transcriptional regulator [Kitasatospora sp.]|jgi:AcrR family transcriptional regulator|nr:TetR/AcrR family transcriptional regulator [Kitasatospora sp.]